MTIRVTAVDLDKPEQSPKIQEVEAGDVVWVVTEPMYLHNAVRHGNGTLVLTFKVDKEPAS